VFESLKRKIRRTCLPFRQSDKGSVAIESAIVFPFFFGFLGIILETGLMMFQEYAIQAGVQDAGRAIRTGTAQQSGWKNADFTAQVCKTASIIGSSCTSKVTVYVNSAANFTALRAAVPVMSAIGPDAAGVAQPTVFNCGGSQAVVTVIATYDHQFIMPFMQFFSNTNNKQMRRLTGFGMFRNEPFPTTTTCT
jgi:Flp pilus assembly protein TadG